MGTKTTTEPSKLTKKILEDLQTLRQIYEDMAIHADNQYDTDRNYLKVYGIEHVLKIVKLTI